MDWPPWSACTISRTVKIIPGGAPSQEVLLADPAGGRTSGGADGDRLLALGRSADLTEGWRALST